MHHYLKAFVADDRGASSVEYALFASLIVVSAVSAISDVGGKLGKSLSALTGAPGDAPNIPQATSRAKSLT